MRKIFWIIIVTITWGACQQEPSYTVTGTVEGTEEGDTVRIEVPIKWRSTITNEMAMTTIKNGKFTFIGRQDTAMFCVLTCEKNGRMFCGVKFVLENGDICINAHPDSCDYDIKGTLLNEKWSTYVNIGKKMWRECVDSWYSDMPEEGYDRDSWFACMPREKYNRTLKEYEERLHAYQIQFCRENIGNILGAYCFYQEQYRWDPVNSLELVKQIPDVYTPEMSLLKVSLLNREKTQVGQPFTDITLNTPDGKKLSVSEVARGCKVTLIDFWASWCGPCRREMPNVKAVYEKYHSKGFDVIGVSLDFKEDAWKKVIVDMDLKWPQISDIKGFDSEGAILYGVDAIPATILIKDGIIVGRNLYEEALGEKVAELLGE